MDRFQSQEKAIEAQRIRQRTQYDMEMIRELLCQGIENYSRVIADRPRLPPMTLLDYFPRGFPSSSWTSPT